MFKGLHIDKKKFKAEDAKKAFNLRRKKLALIQIKMELIIQ